jgi:hypothetical protein
MVDGKNEVKNSELEDLVGRLHKAKEALKHPDYTLTTGTQFGELWGTAQNNVSALRSQYPDYWDGKEIRLQEVVSMYIARSLNRKNNFGSQGAKDKIEGFLYRLEAIDNSINDSLESYDGHTEEISKKAKIEHEEDGIAIPLPETPSTKYEHALLKFPDRKVLVYNPYMTEKEFKGNPRGEIYHPVWDEIGQFQDWHKKDGQFLGVIILFPTFGTRKLALNYSLPPYDKSTNLDLNTWGGHPNAPSPRI